MTPSISLDGVNAHTSAVSFDSSFRPCNGMTGLIDVSFDGGATYANLLTLETSGFADENSSLERINETVNLAANNPAGGEMMVRFGMTNAGNDWWWAMDNVAVSVVPEPTTGMLGLAGDLISLMGFRRRK